MDIHYQNQNTTHRNVNSSTYFLELEKFAELERKDFEAVVVEIEFPQVDHLAHLCWNALQSVAWNRKEE